MSEDESTTTSGQTDPESQNQIDSSGSGANLEGDASGGDSSREISGTDQFITTPPADPESPRSVLVYAQVQQETHIVAGPIPSPAILHAYGEIDPSFPERIVAQFENESAHRRREERRKSAALARDISAGRTQDRIGQILALVVAITMLSVAIWATLAGHDGVGKTAIRSLAVVIAVFVTGKYWRGKNNIDHDDTE